MQQPLHEAKMRKLYCDVSKLSKRKICQLAPQHHQDLQAFQNHLNIQDPPLQLYVYEGWTQHNLHFVGQPYRPPADRVLLMHSQGHFCLIYDPKLFFHSNIICSACGYAYRHGWNHLCKGKCRYCLQFNCDKSPIGMDSFYCIDCQIFYGDKFCYFMAHHMPISGRTSSGIVLCQVRKRCSDCGKLCKRQVLSGQQLREHACKKKSCPFCKTLVPLDHLCHVQAPTELETRGPEKYLLVFFDFETYVKTCRNGQSELLPFPVTALVFCEQCSKEENWPDSCNVCGKKHMNFGIEICSVNGFSLICKNELVGIEN